MQSITSDFSTDDGSPEPQLRAIAAAGFSHVHWCHEWCTDREYTPDDIAQIKRWMDELHLQTLNLHGSDGKTRYWASTDEAVRLAGQALVQNRMEMVARLGGDVVIMHPPNGKGPANSTPAHVAQLKKSLDALQPLARTLGVRIAIENMIDENFGIIRDLLATFPPDYLGLCYDSGHGHISKNGLDNLETLRDRLIALHLHDNDGKNDQHKLILTDSVDWPRLARLIATSAYTNMVNAEVIILHTGIKDHAEFLGKAMETGQTFARMIDAQRPQK